MPGQRTLEGRKIIGPIEGIRGLSRRFLLTCNSMWATRRRTIILLILLCLFLVLVVLPYWLSHREIPSCTDQKQNQEETGVDCGGPCTRLCKEESTPLAIVWTRVFTIRPGVYDVVAQLENKNFSAGMPRLFYTARLFDENGEILAEKRGETFVEPGQRFFIFAGGLLTGDKIAARGELTIDREDYWIRTGAGSVPFSITDEVLIGTDRAPKLTALLHSNSPETLRDIEIVAVVYDSDGKPIGASATKVEKLDRGGTQPLVFTWPNPFEYKARFEECETPVDVVLALDRSGSMRSDGRNPDQPLTDAKRAAASFLDHLSSKDKVGYVSFATAASNPMDQQLTATFDRVRAAIERTAIGTDGTQYTNIGDAIARAVDEFSSLRHESASHPALVLLTDGTPTRPEDPNKKDDNKYASEYAARQAQDAKAQGISIYTIGLGAEVQGEYLASLSTSPEHYFRAPTSAELSEVYRQIATNLCKISPSVIEIIPRVNTVSSLVEN